MSGYKRIQPPGSIPSRWLKCPPKSYELLINKFLIFKTPLSSRYDDQVGDDIFQVQLVFQSMKNKRVKLGLWIDLTKTSRYYDREEVENNKCRYVKLQCEGHSSTPSPAQTKTFIKMCHDFIRQYPLEIIGVHCTHGFNRSGFLVVSYLVEALDWEVGAAIAEFSRIRPPGIYKQDYLIELYRRYDEVECAPAAPPLPDWCNENIRRSYDKYDDRSEDDEKGGRPSRIRFKNYQGNGTPKFMDGVTGVEPVTGELMREIQMEVSKMCGWKRSDFPGSQPVSLSVDNIHYLSEYEYRVSWKADGVRYMMYIKRCNEVYCIDRDNNVFLVRNITFPFKKDLDVHITNTLLDGEMVLDRVNGGFRPRYLIYDIVTIMNYSIKDDDFDKRYKTIEREVCQPREHAVRRGKINNLKEPFGIRQKEFRHVTDAKKYLSSEFIKYLTHPPDGLIFQPSLDPYVPGRCMKVLKWKPLSQNSIDFRLKIETESGIGIVTKKVGKLYVGDNVLFGVLPNVKNMKHLDQKIVECTYENGIWVFMRERTDKSFPNSYETAKSVWESIKNPVREQYLLDFIANHRYRRPCEDDPRLRITDN